MKNLVQQKLKCLRAKADISVIGGFDDNRADDLEDISVVPNPYIVNSSYFNESPGNLKMRFTRLPTECTITIYTISGEEVLSFRSNEESAHADCENLKSGKTDPGILDSISALECDLGEVAG